MIPMDFSGIHGRTRRPHGFPIVRPPSGRLQSFPLKPVCALLSVLQLSCAVQQPPPGGPIDTVPPTILSTFPPSYTTNYAQNKIALEFDKDVDERSVEESIFISPDVGGLEFDWSGREVEATFSRPLRVNTTYVVNIGTDVVDLHNKNRMAQAYTFAFSTGPDIDKGAIDGRIFTVKPEDKPEGVMVFAYNLSGVNADTLDPTKDKPDYITQTGKFGIFAFRHLSLGPYRVMAVRDEYRNLLYDREVDEYGVQSIPIVLSAADTMTRGILMKMALEDTTAPRLIKFESRNATHLWAEFSEPLDTATIRARNFAVTDTLSLAPLRILSVYPSSDAQKVFTFVSEPQDSQRTYRLTIAGIRDRAGNLIHPSARSLTASGSDKRDSVGLRLASVSLKDSTVGVVPNPVISVRFTDAVMREEAGNAIRMEDTLGREVPTVHRWNDDISVWTIPIHHLNYRTWYRLKIFMRQMKDARGVTSRDSTRSFRFQTIEEDAFSSIEGDVRDLRTSDTTGTIVVLATKLGVEGLERYAVDASSSGAFIFSELGEGKYVLQAYRDRNGNGEYDAGKPFPYVPSERLSPLTDTLKVRARWPLDGVKIEMP